MARRVGLPHAVATARARTGLFLAVRQLVEPGREVVLSPYTIHEVVNMVICAGGVPVFADIDRATCNLDPAAAQAAITESTGAVLATHLHGLAMDLEPMARWCAARGIALIEDAAQAFGARVGGRSVGSFGDAGVFSFGMYKNLTSFLGGMLVTPHQEAADGWRRARSSYPATPFGEILGEMGRAASTDLATWPPLFRPLVFPLFRFGYLRGIGWLNSRVTVESNPLAREGEPREYMVQMRSAQAKVALDRMEGVDEDVAVRIEHARRYQEGLGDLDALLLPPWREDGSHTYSYFPVQFEDREALIRHMMRSGCDVAAQHLRNCADLPCFEAYARDCPQARLTAASTILLPTYPRYGVEDVERNVRAIRCFFGRNPGGAVFS
ncbi:DegT/DnrJ/EryC1/StrS family aminotransferase [Myxococcota bacterium]|nr:DegT/DnrJ/EryC1/StrS family aminotransferase [Myxococcota bacterium]